MPRSKNRSSGFTVGGFVLLLIVAMVVAFFGMKVGPMYVEFGSVKQAMEGLATESYPSASEVKKSLIKRMDINYVTSVADSDIKVKPANGAFEVTVDYYVEKTLFSNLTVTAYFEHTVQTQ